MNLLTKLANYVRTQYLLGKAATTLHTALTKGTMTQMSVMYLTHGRAILTFKGVDTDGQEWGVSRFHGALSSSGSVYGNPPAYLGNGEHFLVTTKKGTEKVSMLRAFEICTKQKGLAKTEKERVMNDAPIKEYSYAIKA